MRTESGLAPCKQCGGPVKIVSPDDQYRVAYWIRHDDETSDCDWTMAFIARNGDEIPPGFVSHYFALLDRWESVNR